MRAPGSGLPGRAGSTKALPIPSAELESPADSGKIGTALASSWFVESGKAFAHNVKSALAS